MAFSKFAIYFIKSKVGFLFYNRRANLKPKSRGGFSMCLAAMVFSRFILGGRIRLVHGNTKKQSFQKLFFP